MKLLGVIRTAHQRPAGYVHETHLARLFAKRLEPVRTYKLAHRRMFERWLEILTQSENVAAGGAQLTHRGEQFVLLFTESQHKARFCKNRRTAFSFDLAQDTERAVVGC